jgi:hypothetical protein
MRLAIPANLHALVHALIILCPESPQVKPVLPLANAGRSVEECKHERIAVFTEL